ncbi:hypothetical protein JY97_08285 [Alkalispirochaeta odontotermitis]|nr:hypothetical protein JY97_08285 [Alkalispirochaeta odontotermitis]CAB1079824.1 hypothetical protein D1AOALGA4SA_7526 [Olavius algarvensis Delta 1 endosymbiont]
MKTRLQNFNRLGIIGLLIVIMCWGCAGVEQKIDAWQAPFRENLNSRLFGDSDGDGKYFIHTSQWRWETLGYVAEWYTGKSKNQKKLADVNPSIRPGRIAVGSKVKIPVGLLKTREPLPKNFSGEYRADNYIHTVRWPGESLSLIASWYTGASKNWRKLAKYNPRLNPNRIKVGNVILIPPSLLKTRVALPQKVAAKFTPGYFSYKVKKNTEKLSDIARWYTGKSSNRKRLAKANPDLNPYQLKRGNEVYIPKNLLITRAPKKVSQPAASLSKPAAGTAVTHPKPAAVIPPKPAAEEDEDENIKLFGPKQHPNQ